MPNSVSIPQCRSEQFRRQPDLVQRRLRGQVSIPLIQIRAIPTDSASTMLHTKYGSQKSQSFHTDQGNSDFPVHRLQHLQGLHVSIPQYKSGQFRRCYEDWCADERSSRVVKSQSLNADQGNSDAISSNSRNRKFFCLNPSIQIRAVPTSTGPVQGLVGSNAGMCLNPSIQIRAVPTKRSVQAIQVKRTRSQSLNTDQGSSDGTLGRPLKIKGLNDLFFQPPEEPCFFRSRTFISSTSLSRNLHNDSDFHPISGRCVKMASWCWHDFCLACNSVVRERSGPDRPAADDRREHHKRLRAAGQSRGSPSEDSEQEGRRWKRRFI